MAYSAASMLAVQDRFLDYVYDNHGHNPATYKEWQDRYFGLPLKSRCQLLSMWQYNGATRQAAQTAASMVA